LMAIFLYPWQPLEEKSLGRATQGWIAKFVNRARADMG
jgi:hypothetical protein